MFRKIQMSLELTCLELRKIFCVLPVPLSAQRGYSQHQVQLQKYLPWYLPWVWLYTEMFSPSRIRVKSLPQTIQWDISRGVLKRYTGYHFRVNGVVFFFFRFSPTSILVYYCRTNTLSSVLGLLTANRSNRIHHDNLNNRCIIKCNKFF